MIVLSTILLIVTAIYLYIKYTYSHWRRYGFPYIKPSIPFGNLGLVAARKASFGINLYELHKQTNEPFIGIYMLFRPAILIRDAKLIKNVLANDFAYFHDRGVYCNPEYDPLSENLFAMPGNRWKSLRAKLTPTFTSGKLRNMLPTIMDEGDRLENYLVPFAADNAVVEMKDLLSRYALNVTASVIFGIDVDTIKDPKHSFRAIEHRINNPELINVIKGVSVFLYPKFLEFFKLSSMPADVKDFMVNIVKQQIDHRERNNVSRKDFIQFLIQLRNTGKVMEDDALWDVETSADTLKSMSIEQCAAQVFLFYVAGFETTSSTIAYCLFEFAQSQEILRKIQDEIDATLQKYDGKLSYECIQEMDYIELCILGSDDNTEFRYLLNLWMDGAALLQCLSLSVICRYPTIRYMEYKIQVLPYSHHWETIRKYPALPLLNRECTQDYAVPGSDLTIKKGTAIIISLMGLSRDPKYFPEPELYRPERYSDPEPQYDTDAYIPFGEGPRACIGLRLGKMVAKIGLIKLLKRYDFVPLDNKELEFDNFAVTLMVKGGINLTVSNRTEFNRGL